MSYLRKVSFKVLFVSSILALTASCQDTLDTSSDQAKEQSVKQMMVGVYPQNQKIFKHALKTLYINDLKANQGLPEDEVMALTDKRLKGKTIEEILHLSFLSKKTIHADPPQIMPTRNTVIVSNVNTPKTSSFIKSNLITK